MLGMTCTRVYPWLRSHYCSSVYHPYQAICMELQFDYAEGSKPDSAYNVHYALHIFWSNMAELYFSSAKGAEMCG